MQRSAQAMMPSQGHHQLMHGRMYLVFAAVIPKIVDQSPMCLCQFHIILLRLLQSHLLGDLFVSICLIEQVTFGIRFKNLLPALILMASNLVNPHFSRGAPGKPDSGNLTLRCNTNT